MDKYKAEISTTSTEYFPDAPVFHELRHIRRFLADGIPKLLLCDDYEWWEPELEKAILRLASWRTAWCRPWAQNR
jgi:hypothetical protein